MTRFTVSLRCRRLLVGLSLSSVLAGCLSTRAPTGTPVGDALEVDLTARRARVGSYSLAERIMSTIEITADEIASRSQDPRVKRRALEWKAYAIPSVQSAAFHHDPYVGYLDVWSLLLQMQAYFQTGMGRELFGDEQQLAIDAAGILVRDCEQRVSGVLGGDELARLRDLVSEFAVEHPLDNDLHLYRSVTEAMPAILAVRGSTGLAALASMQDVAQDAQEVALIVASYVPKQIRWQSQLLISEIADPAAVAPLLDSIDRMAVTSAATRLLESAPELVAAERRAVLEALIAERVVLLEAFAGTREDIVADLELTSRRTLDHLFELERDERAVILEELARIVAAERTAVLAEVDGLGKSTFSQTHELVDHVSIRVLQTGAALVALVLLATVVVVLLLKRTRAS